MKQKNAILRGITRSINRRRCEWFMGLQIEKADRRRMIQEVVRLRSIIEDLYAYIVSDAHISLEIIEEQMDWRDM